MNIRLLKFVLLLGFLFTITFVGLAQSSVYAAQAVPDIVFVARAHLSTEDDIFEEELGPAGQFGTGLTKFAPGSKLMIRHSNGSLTTLVDGSNPSAATGNLIDVHGPDVSFDGTKILFAGATTTDRASNQYGWRLYEINVNGSGFRKLPLPDRTFTTVPEMGNFNFGNQDTYGWWNDLFPAYLADGRIVFVSTRYPSRANYDDRFSYNIYTVNSDGSNLTRITTDRGGFLHPTPLPDGRILTTRWWNNFNQPSAKGIFNRIDNRDNTYFLPDGTRLDANPDKKFDPATGLLPGGTPVRNGPNTWHLMVLNPDGTDMHRYAFTAFSIYNDKNLTDDDGLDSYAASQPALISSGGEQLIAFTAQKDASMVHSTHHTGIRIARTGGASMMYANTNDSIAGYSFNLEEKVPPYALHPWGLADGSILFSYTTTPNPGLPSSGTYIDPVTSTSVKLQGSDLQYSLYTMDIDGSNKTLLPTSIGTADAMDAKPIEVRTGWSNKAPVFTAAPPDDPRQWDVPNTIPAYSFSQKGLNDIATSILHNPNVYANAPLDLPFINNSPLPGSVAKAQVYIDANQFTGAYCYGSYPNPCETFQHDTELRAILWDEVDVTLTGAFTIEVPADIPGFVVLRDANGYITSGWKRGYASIAQGNAWTRPGETVTCTGCHLGHVSGTVDAVQSEASQGWTNVAPYASVQASSSYVSSGEIPFPPERLNDRRGWIPIPAGGPPSKFEETGQFQDDEYGWMSEGGQGQGAVITMQWPLSMRVNKIRLVGPPSTGGDWNGYGRPASKGPYYVTAGTLRFYKNGVEVGSQSVGQIEPFTNGGTWVNLPSPVEIDKLTFTIESFTGQWHYENVAALNEIEVIGQAAERIVPSDLFSIIHLPIIMK